jgi:hypothetical protein
MRVYLVISYEGVLIRKKLPDSAALGYVECFAGICCGDLELDGVDRDSVCGAF